jgi:rod shape-determining protein MreD
MHYLLLIPIVYLAAVAETSRVDVIRVGEATPDLLVLAAVVWALTAKGRRAFLVAGLVTLVGDLIAPGRLGLGMFWMLPVGYAITRLRARVRLDHVALQAPAALLAVTVWAAAVGLSARLLGEITLPWPTIVGRAAGVGLYTAGVSVPVLMLIGWIREPRIALEKQLAKF